MQNSCFLSIKISVAIFFELVYKFFSKVIKEKAGLLVQSTLDLVNLQIVKFLDLVKFLLLTDFLLNKTLEIVKFLPIFWKFNFLI